MIIPRLAFMALRLAQFICATVVLGLASYLLYLEHKHNIGPFSRLLYSAIIAATSLITSLISLVSRAISPVTHIVADLLFCGAWFAVFGLLQDWYEDVMHCGSKWN
jgi:Mn2+/Fe2+ NRAMP family transporter